MMSLQAMKIRALRAEALADSRLVEISRLKLVIEKLTAASGVVEQGPIDDMGDIIADAEISAPNHRILNDAQIKIEIVDEDTIEISAPLTEEGIEAIESVLEVEDNLSTIFHPNEPNGFGSAVDDLDEMN